MTQTQKKERYFSSLMQSNMLCLAGSLHFAPVYFRLVIKGYNAILLIAFEYPGEFSHHGLMIRMALLRRIRGGQQSASPISHLIPVIRRAPLLGCSDRHVPLCSYSLLLSSLLHLLFLLHSSCCQYTDDDDNDKPPFQNRIRCKESLH